jgi:hypothetical protein
MINLNLDFSSIKFIFSLIDVLAVIIPILMAIAFMTILERKQLAAHQRRVGPALWFGKLLMWDKLSNSGNTLKLMISNYILKSINGWTNYSGKVISRKINENEMGYRGSKSKLNFKFAKEQRVYGSWWIRSRSIHLRCTLMGFERNYQIKYPSKQLNILNYSTFNYKSNLNSWFITGLVDGEGSFITAINKNLKYKTGWRLESRFQIGLNIRDLPLLLQLQQYFGGIGSISNNQNMVVYIVSKLNDLNNVIIPHFKIYPLLTQKGADFILFQQVIEIVNKKEHLSIEGISKIINIKAAMNLGISEKFRS